MRGGGADVGRPIGERRDERGVERLGGGLAEHRDRGAAHGRVVIVEEGVEVGGVRGDRARSSTMRGEAAAGGCDTGGRTGLSTPRYPGPLTIGGSSMAITDRSVGGMWSRPSTPTR